MKLIILVIVLCFPILHSSTVIGQDNIPDLKGKWSGTVFLCADAKGFSSSNKSINLIIKKQFGFDFSGNIETKDKDTMQVLEFSGFLDKKKRYICVITHEGYISIGYLITKNTMKVHLGSFGNNPKITVYRLVKEKFPD